jgi:hypothetical protein
VELVRLIHRADESDDSIFIYRNDLVITSSLFRLRKHEDICFLTYGSACTNIRVCHRSLSVNRAAKIQLFGIVR